VCVDRAETIAIVRYKRHRWPDARSYSYISPLFE
jgi:hypothetical protein